MSLQHSSLTAVFLVAALSACAHSSGGTGAGAGSSARPGASRRADLVLVNGRVFTARSDSEVVSALAIGGGRVLAVGDRAAVAAYIKGGARVVDLRGRFVAPGFHDAHVHLESAGRALSRLDLAGVKSLATALAKVGVAAKRRPKGRWIVGRGWDHTLWGGRWPTRRDLDRVAPDHPVALWRIDGHVVWVNSKALAASKVTAATRAPVGGEIVREPGSREPSGIFKERATALIKARASRDAGARRADIARALAVARRRGVTSLQELGTGLAPLLALARAGKLTARVTLWTQLDGDFARAERRRRALAPGGASAHPLIRAGALKGFVDGTLGSRTAALLAPYADAAAAAGGKKGKPRGTLRHAPGKLEALVREASRRGFQVALHAIGDRAIRRALDAYARVDAKARARLRHRVEHVQVLAPADLPRFAKLGVIASLQPCHLSTDQRWVEKRLGAARAKARGYLWRAIASSGARIALGTDWPVEPVDPLKNLYAAVTRRRVETPDKPGWNAEQRLTIGRALRAYTAGSAYAGHVETRRGTLAPGMDADLVVVDKNLLKIAPRELLRARVVATVLAGKVVYGAL